MPVPVVATAYRIPLGEAGGVFEDIQSEDLSVTLVDRILDERDADPSDVEDLTWDVAQQHVEQDNNVARVITLLLALGGGTPTTNVNRWYASSMRIIVSASNTIAAGNRERIVAGGVESTSRVPMGGDSYKHLHPELNEQYDVFQLQMGMTAERVAEECEVSRGVQDEFAFRSHQRIAEATNSGCFDDEIVPIETADGVVTEDKDIRRDTSMEALSGLDPVFSGNGSVTAGNSSQITDGATAILVTNREFAEDRGPGVLASVGTNNVADVDPTVMGIGPVPTTHDLLDRAGTDVDDYGLIEINEAFASQCEYSRCGLGIDADSLNVNGGAIVLGHPLGTSDARLSVTLIHEIQEHDVDRGLASLCVDFGRGVAIEFSR